MYHITIFSIIRQAMKYIDRYERQVRSVFEGSDDCRLVLCEGDSTDGTKERLKTLDVGGKVDVITLDLGGPLYPSVDDPARWKQLETCWNTCIEQIQPTRYAICVECDLIWSADTVERLMSHLLHEQCEVVCPMLMTVKPGHGLRFYDCNAFVKDGVHFESVYPYHPALTKGDQFVRLDTGGGMLVTTYFPLYHATWRDKCVLHFKPPARTMLDTQLAILHPQ